MKNKSLAIIAALVLSLFATSAMARDERLRFPIEDAMTTEDALARLDPNVRFFFGDQPYGDVVQRFGEFRTNKKTNAFNKSDQRACEWAFLSAIVQLQKRALREGGNAVVNIRSNYKSQEYSSATEYECGAGTFLAGVALIGTVVKLP
ncbi:MAG TPA: excinuclease ABC subunit A [Gammaproteobacteria bacterium]|nr:excinuclease ABC subunit A [Gammaproteobacteria bacterium]